MLSPENLPKHVAIIMDGNGRWAEQKKHRRVFGHIRGTRQVKEIVTASRNLGVQVLTLYAFSTENWKRPDAEVGLLFRLFEKFLLSEEESMIRNGIQLRILGDMSAIPESARKSALRTISKTQACREMVLNIAVNYGGHWDIVQAANSLVNQQKPITEQSLTQALSTAELPAVDLLIRTGGDRRISNFLLWQAAYAELVFLELPWPEFRKDHLVKVLTDFTSRDRRFGGIVNSRGAQI